MNQNQITAADLAYLEQRRETSTAYLWWFFLGVTGAHLFYLGRKGLGWLYLLTLGLLGVGVLVDLFLIPRRVRKRNAEIAAALGLER